MAQFVGEDVFELDAFAVVFGEALGDLFPKHAVHHDVVLFSRVQLVRARTGKVKADFDDPLDLRRRVRCRVDGAPVAVFKRDDFFGFAKIGATGQFTQNEDVEAFDNFTAQR